MRRDAGSFSPAIDLRRVFAVSTSASRLDEVAGVSGVVGPVGVIVACWEGVCVVVGAVVEEEEEAAA